jgi:hypothetical protein
MKKDVKLALPIMATVLVLLAAGFIIAACGPGLEPEVKEKTYTVTFYNGSTVVKTESGLAEGDKITTAPSLSNSDWVTPEFPTAVGLHKISPTISFGGWTLTPNGSTTETFPFTIGTSDVKFYAKWNETGATWSTVTITGSTGTTLQKAVTTIKTDPTTRTSSTQFYLLLDTNDAPDQGETIRLDAANIKLTIAGKGDVTIKSPNLVNNGVAQDTNNRVFIKLGVSTETAATGSVSLTLKNIWVEGSGYATPDSLIRVENGATLILDQDSKVWKHQNNAGLTGGAIPTTGSGTNGNGSAICVINGGKLIVKPQAYVQENKALGNQANTNLVGGIYAHGNNAATVRSTVIIEGGVINNNTCTAGNTGDIYISDSVDLTMNGTLTIGELTLNADIVGTGATAKLVSAVIKIPSAVSNKVSKLCLRSTEPLTSNEGGTAAQGLATTIENWTGTQVLQGTGGYTITSNDVAKFELGDFRGSMAFTGNGIDANNFKIADSGADLGKLVTKQ